MIDRRNFLAGAASVSAMSAMPAVAQRARPAIGLQLYTLRTLFEADPVATLEQVAKIGYREVEYGGGGYDGMDHAMLRRTTDRLGLRAPSIHVGYDALHDRFDQTVKMARTLGADTVILAGVDNKSRTDAGWREAVTLMNSAARRLKAGGLGFAYHNHEWEFVDQAGGMSLYDWLIKEGDPKLVKLELDVFWAVKAGKDPLALVRELSGRLYAYHVKDMTQAGEMTSVGLGQLDYTSIFRLNRRAGVRHFYVENDRSPAPYWPDVTTSFTNLERLLGR